MNYKRTYYLFLFSFLIIFLGNPLIAIQTDDEYDNDFFEKLYRNPNKLNNKSNLKKYLKVINNLRTKDSDSYKSEMKELTFLEAAFRIKSYDMLKEFFDSWTSESIPFDTLEFQLKPQFEKEVYNIFYKVYQPLNMRVLFPRYEGMDSSNESLDFCLNKKYILIQDRISIELYQEEHYKGEYCHLVHIYMNDSVHNNDTIYENVKSKLQIIDFSPNILLDGYKIIYCTKDFLKILNDFIGNLIFDKKTGDYELSMESKKRLEFLNHFTSIFKSNYSDYYIIETFPIINIITLNLNNTEAIVHVRIGDRSIRLLMSKKNGIWEIIYKSDET